MNNMNENYYKYLKYKTKYINILSGGGEKTTKSRYECDPNKPFSEICYEKEDGTYKSKESCVNDCETKYINRNLIDAKLKYETNQFKSFIYNLFDEDISVYIKGGTVLGLKILKMIYDKYKDDNFEKYFEKFLELNLVRDWDFASYVNENTKIDESYRKKMDDMSRKIGLVPRAKTFILYQTRKPIELDDQVLFEITILDSENYADLELPMTTMKTRIGKRNINHIFMFAKSFYSYKVNNEPFDLDIIKHMLENLKINIYPHENGLFKTDNNTFDEGNLSKNLLNFIAKFTNNNRDLEQFLITHIQEPHRLFFRFLEKNVPKVDKISKFLKENNISNTTPNWLFDVNKMMKMINSFIDQLGSKMVDIYKEKTKGMSKPKKPDTVLMSRSYASFEREIMKNDEYVAAIEFAMKDVDEFITGINLKRFETEIERFNDEGKKLIGNLFRPLYKEIESDLDELSDDIKLIHTIKFLKKRDVVWV